MAEIIRSYRDFKACKRQLSWVTEIYRLTQTFPKEEMFGLMSQVRRAAVSIPSNIAEDMADCRGRNISIFWGMLGDRWRNWKLNWTIGNNLGYSTMLLMNRVFGPVR